MPVQSKNKSSSICRLVWLTAITSIISLVNNLFGNILAGLISDGITSLSVWIVFSVSSIAFVFFTIRMLIPHENHDITDNLDSNETSAPPHISPAALLVARYQIVPFNWHIRQKEEEYLQQWCFSSKPVDIALFTGPGGTGKTRLFIEWSKIMRKKYRWNAGFLRQNQFHSDDTFDTLRKSTFIVIDYAECWRDLSAFLALIVACKPSNKAKLRVVLLAREQSDWWLALKENEGCRELGAFLSSVSHHVLSSITVAGEEREKIYREAYEAFSTAIKKNKPFVEMDHRAGEYGRPLYLHVAALNALLANNTVLSPQLLLKEMVLHERNFWMEQFGSGLDDLHKDLFRNFASRLVAALTLRGGCSTQQQAVVLFGKLSGSPSVADVNVFTEFLHRLYLGQKGAYLGTLEPDLIGEELVRSVLTQSATGTDFLDIILETADAASLMNAFVVLGRIGSHDPEVAEKWIALVLKKVSLLRIEAAIHAAIALGRDGIASPLVKVLADVTANIEDVSACKKIYSLLPLQSFSLAKVAVSALMNQIQSLNGNTDDKSLAERASLLNNIGNHFRNLGCREEALRSTQEAVNIRRKLSEKKPDAFLHLLSTSLNNESIMLGNLGRHEGAVSPLLEAIAINRRMAEKDPDIFLPELASNLSNLGDLLRLLGRFEDALSPAQDAVNISRQLLTKSPTGSNPGLPASLNNLALILQNLRRQEEALGLMQEANTNFRNLSEKDPDPFLLVLANGLQNIGILLADLNRHEEALKPVQEAVGIFRRMEKQNSGAFLPDLAMSLSNLGFILRDLHRPNEAIVPAQESVAIRRCLSEENPDIFLPKLAQSLTNLGLILNDSGHSKEALDPAQEAVNILRAQLKKNLGTYLPDFASFLSNLGVILRNLERHKEALAAFREADDIHRRLVK